MKYSKIPINKIGILEIKYHLKYVCLIQHFCCPALAKEHDEIINNYDRLMINKVHTIHFYIESVESYDTFKIFNITKVVPVCYNTQIYLNKSPLTENRTEVMLL